MTQTAARAHLSVDRLATAARELGRAGRWESALCLVESATAADTHGRAVLALVAAEIAMEATWFGATDLAGSRLDEAELTCAPVDLDAAQRWDLAFLRGRYDYFRQLHASGHFLPGPAGKDPTALGELRQRFGDLRDRGPDAARRGWAEMYLGLITDNLYGDRAAAPSHYEAALAVARLAADDLLAREALRHLGDHDHDAGDHDGALQRWREATTLGARAGAVVGTLSQQMLLAVLARDQGDTSGSAALATEIARWAGALGAVRLEAQATAFVTGADPTAAPTSANEPR